MYDKIKKKENYQKKFVFLGRNETSYFEENYIIRALSCVKKYFQKVADLLTDCR